MNSISLRSAGLSRWALIGWTLLLWGSRLRLVLGNDELDGWGIVIRVLVVGVFVALAILVAVRASPRTLALLVWWTLVYWLVRGGAILLSDEDLAFKGVHAALMVISWSTAVWAWRARQPGST